MQLFVAVFTWRRDQILAPLDPTASSTFSFDICKIGHVLDAFIVGGVVVAEVTKGD